MHKYSVGKMKTIFAAIALIFIAFVSPTRTQADLSQLKLDERRVADFDTMAERNFIRALVPYSKTFYFLDGADQRGFTYEFLQEFERYINRELKRKTLKVRLVVIPTKRDRLLTALVEGLGDIAAANLTITHERQKLVDFSDPVLTGVEEILVTGANTPSVNTIDDLAGKEVHVRASSSYYESLKNLNNRFKREGKKPIKIVLADELLEDEDLLEMMNAGLIPRIVIDSHKGRFWSQIFKDLKIHPDIKLNTCRQIAWAVRKNNPQLKNIINKFWETHKKGTLMGNILFRRYLENTKRIHNSFDEEELKRFKEAAVFFQKYSDQYDFDWMMVAAQAYQESRIDQTKRSPAGAIGVMQVLPSTAKDPNVNIPNIEELEANIHAGIKYLRFITDRYFKRESMDQLNRTLFSFASYNAGPARVSALRREASQVGLDPNVWFHNVEIVAAERIGRETVHYVSNIYKYYTAYRLINDKRALKEELKMKMNGK